MYKTSLVQISHLLSTFCHQKCTKSSGAVLGVRNFRPERYSKLPAMHRNREIKYYDQSSLSILRKKVHCSVNMLTMRPNEHKS